VKTLKTHFFPLLLLAVMVGAFVLVFRSPKLQSFNGIVAAPSGQAVYLAGEACTVNMTLDRELDDLEADWRHCMNHHALVMKEQAR